MAIIFEKMIEELMTDEIGAAIKAGRMCPGQVLSGQLIMDSDSYRYAHGKPDYKGCRGITCLECRMGQYKEVEVK